MADYITPADVGISDNRAAHIARGSREPGTDYRTAPGTDLRVPGNGVVRLVDTNPGGAEGRRLSFQMDDGKVIDWLHLSRIMVGNGQRVTRGQTGVALSGGSGFGKENYYGSHVHVTLRANAGMPYSNTLNFENYVGSPADISKGQRTVGSDIVNRRTQPTSQSALAGDPLAPGTVGNFTGWIHGENVKGNDVWYKGISGDWFWSGGFVEGANGTGLADLNTTTPPVGATQRQVLPTDSVKRRSAPTTQSPEAGDPLPAGTIGNFDGWTHGESVSGNDVWFRGTPSGNWFWSVGFVGGANTAGLPEVGGTVTPPDPGSVLDPTAPWKSQTPDSALVDKWIGSPNYNNSASGLGAKTKTHIDMHWFGTNATLAGTDAEFQNPGTIKNGRGTGKSSQYGIGADGTVHQYVLEKDYAHTNGTYEGNATGITIEHEAGPNKPATAATIQKSAELLADIAKRHGWEKLEWLVNVFPHKYFVATECPGTLETDAIIKAANVILAGTPEVPDDEAERLLIRTRALLTDIEAYLDK